MEIRSETGKVRLTVGKGAWDYTIMKLVADAHGRLTAAKHFRPGTAFDLSLQADGSYRLVELVEKKNPRAKLIREKGRTLLVTSRPVTLEDTQKALEDFP